MLRWVVLLMIALLPLRGWVGVATAHESGAGAAMMAQAQAGAPARSSDGGAAAGPAHEDCTGHHAQFPSSASEDGAGHQAAHFLISMAEVRPQ